MRSKVFLISVLMIFFTCCFEGCTSTTATAQGPLYGDIDAHYYRVNTEYPENSDSVRIFLSWQLFQSKLMNKVEDHHFQLDLKHVPNNSKYRGDFSNAHIIRIFDAKRTGKVTSKIVLNGTELKIVGETTDGSVLYFWFDGRSVYGE